MRIGRFWVTFAKDGDDWKWRCGPHDMWSPPYDTREEAEKAARKALED